MNVFGFSFYDDDDDFFLYLCLLIFQKATCLESSTPDSGKGRCKSSINRVSHGFHLVEGKSSHDMEDYHVAEYRNKKNGVLGLFAIFDGHLGSSVPSYLKDNLFNNILEEVPFPHLIFLSFVYLFIFLFYFFNGWFFLSQCRIFVFYLPLIILFPKILLKRWVINEVDQHVVIKFISKCTSDALISHSPRTHEAPIWLVNGFSSRYLSFVTVHIEKIGREKETHMFLEQ